MASSSPNMSRFATSLVAFLVFQVTFNPFIAANAQSVGLNIPNILPGIVPTGLLGAGGIIMGKLCCPGSGATCPGLGIANTLVFLSCTNGLRGSGNLTILGEGLTNLNGDFNITARNTADFLSNPLGIPILSCNVVVRLPLNSTACPGLNTKTGLLVGTVRFAGTLLTAVLGLVQVFVAVNGFDLMPR